MITVAIATRTMDRQRRYRSLLPTQSFAIVSALDCPTLAQMVKGRPVDVIVFDIQRPAMPADEWIELIAGDPDLSALPIAWVGRDVSKVLFDRVCAITNSELVPPRPDSQVLVQAITKLAKENRHSSKSADQSGWQPGEDIIEDALSIFDQTDGEEQSSLPTAEEDNWLVSEVVGGSSEPDKNEKDIAGEVHQDSRPVEADEPTEESSITLDSEEIGTGSFGVVPHKKTTSSHPNLINEKIMGITTRPGQLRSGPEQIEQITEDILHKLAARLADEMVARINPDVIRTLVEQALTRPESVPGQDTPANPS